MSRRPMSNSHPPGDWHWCSDQELKDHIAFHRAVIRDHRDSIRDSQTVIATINLMLREREARRP